MSDQKLRELERRWRESGSVEDEAAYLRERVRVGDLTQERLELAAYCGHEGALRVTQLSPCQPSPEALTERATAVGKRVVALIALTVADLVLEKSGEEDDARAGLLIGWEYLRGGSKDCEQRAKQWVAEYQRAVHERPRISLAARTVLCAMWTVASGDDDARVLESIKTGLPYRMLGNFRESGALAVRDGLRFLQDVDRDVLRRRLIAAVELYALTGEITRHV